MHEKRLHIVNDYSGFGLVTITDGGGYIPNPTRVFVLSPLARCRGISSRAGTPPARNPRNSPGNPTDPQQQQARGVNASGCCRSSEGMSRTREARRARGWGRGIRQSAAGGSTRVFAVPPGCGALDGRNSEHRRTRSRMRCPTHVETVSAAKKAGPAGSVAADGRPPSMVQHEHVTSRKSYMHA